MSSPEVQRRLRQQGADVESLYEISSRIEGQLAQLAQETNARFDAVDTQFDGVNSRLEAQQQRSDARFDALESTLARILERLDRD
ncbi:hypothetical protein [Pseudonocardia sp. NPDC049635]|uniref:hypothetical protein n=1 Tax=Pseudonocardia sp. NPDC049635 TaxID=3155506 RepID=UPI0033C2B9E3